MNNIIYYGKSGQRYPIAIPEKLDRKLMDKSAYGKCCRDTHEGFMCSLDIGHSGPHIALAGIAGTVAVWEE